MRTTILVALLMLLWNHAEGQVEGQLLPSDIKQQTIVTEPATLSKGFFRTGIFISYSIRDKYFDGEGLKQYYLNSTWGSTTSYLVNFEYGITSRLMIDVFIPVNAASEQFSGITLQPETNTDLTEKSDIRGRGIGDGRLKLSFRIADEKKNRVSLTGTLEAIIPTGEKNPTNIKSLREYNLPTGSGFWSAGAGLTARIVFYPYSATAFAGYVNRFSGKKLATPADIAETRFRDGNSIEAGGSFNFHLNDWIVAANQLRYTYKGPGEISDPFNIVVDPQTSFLYEAQLIFQAGRFRIGESVKIPLSGTGVSADPRFEVLMQYIF